MATMIECVARAIRRKYNVEILDRDEDDGWEYSLGQARAAIDAMREPTEGMVEAAYDAASMDDRWHIEDGRDYRRAHSAALASALEEKS